MGTGPDPGPGGPPESPGPALGAPRPPRPGSRLGEARRRRGAEVPPAEIETIYLFRPIKREGREWGTAVITRRHPEGRLVVYTARYMLVVRGKEKGQSRVEVSAVALSPAEVVAQVMQQSAERSGEAEPPLAFGPGVWYEG